MTATKKELALAEAAAKKEQALGEEHAKQDADYLIELGELIHIDLSGDLDDLWARAIDQGNRAIVATAKQGMFLLALKEQLPHGQFSESCGTWNIPPRRARESMRIAKFLLTVSKSVKSGATLKKLLNLPVAKATALAKLDPEVFFGEQSELDIDEISLLSTPELRQHVRTLNNTVVDKDSQIALQREQILAHQNDTGAGIPGSEFPPSVTRTRMEGAALANQAIDVIASIDRHTEHLLKATDLGATKGERNLNMREGVVPLYLHYAAIQTRLNVAIQDLHNNFHDLLPQDCLNAEEQPAPMNKTEAAKLDAWRTIHVRQQTAAALNREDERIAGGQIKRARGRPSKPAALLPAKRGPGRPSKKAA